MSIINIIKSFFGFLSDDPYKDAYQEQCTSTFSEKKGVENKSYFVIPAEDITE